MDLRTAVEATYDAGTASIRETGPSGVNYEGELRFDGPAVRTTSYPSMHGPSELVLQLDGDLWMWAEDYGWVRWLIGAPRRRGDGRGVLDLVASLTDVRADGEASYVGRTRERRPLCGAGDVRVLLDGEGRVCRVVYAGPSGEQVVEFWDFGRAVEIAAPDDYEIFDPSASRRASRPTRFAGRNSPVRRARRRRRRGGTT